MKVGLSILLLLLCIIFSTINSKPLSLPISPKNNWKNERDLNQHINKFPVNSHSKDVYSIQMHGDPIEIRSIIYAGGIPQEVIIDSGSIQLVIPSSVCSRCHQEEPYYHPSASMKYIECSSKHCNAPNYCFFFSEAKRSVCGNQVHYLDNTLIRTVLVQDKIKFDKDMEDVVNTFGAIIDQEGGHNLNYGIMGMGNTCKGCLQSPIDSLFEKSNLTKIFGLYLDQEYSGFLTLGDLDKRYFDEIRYTPLNSIEDIHYGVFVSYVKAINPETEDGIILNSSDVGDAIIDTGSSFTLLNKQAFQVFKDFMQQDCRVGLCGDETLFDGHCFNVPMEYFNDFPTISLGMLGGAEISISPQSYITSMEAGGRTYYCLGIRESPLEKKSIFGLSWLRNTYVVFDKEHNRMGFGIKVDYDYSSGENVGEVEGSQPELVPQQKKISKIAIHIENNFQEKEYNFATDLKPENEITIEEHIPIPEIPKHQHKPIYHSFFEQLEKLLSQSETFEDFFAKSKLMMDQPSNHTDSEKVCRFNPARENSGIKKQVGMMKKKQPLKVNNSTCLLESREFEIYTQSTKMCKINFKVTMSVNNGTCTMDSKLHEIKVLTKLCKRHIFPKYFNNKKFDNSTCDIFSKHNELNKNNKGVCPSFIFNHFEVDKFNQTCPIPHTSKHIFKLTGVAKSRKHVVPDEIFTKQEESKSVLSFLELPISRKSRKFLADTSCYFDFTQKKNFEWVDNKGMAFLFWESTILNKSPSPISEFVLSTYDKVQDVIGMNYTLTSNGNAIISLPSTVTIAPNQSYRWIYISNSKESLSFSLVSSGTCVNKN